VAKNKNSSETIHNPNSKHKTTIKSNKNSSETIHNPNSKHKTTIKSNKNSSASITISNSYLKNKKIKNAQFSSEPPNELEENEIYEKLDRNFEFLIQRANDDYEKLENFLQTKFGKIKEVKEEIEDRKIIFICKELYPAYFNEIKYLLNIPQSTLSDKIKLLIDQMKIIEINPIDNRVQLKKDVLKKTRGIRSEKYFGLGTAISQKDYLIISSYLALSFKKKVQDMSEKYKELHSEYHQITKQEYLNKQSKTKSRFIKTKEILKEYRGKELNINSLIDLLYGEYGIYNSERQCRKELKGIFTRKKIIAISENPNMVKILDFDKEQINEHKLTEQEKNILKAKPLKKG